MAAKKATAKSKSKQANASKSKSEPVKMEEMHDERDHMENSPRRRVSGKLIIGLVLMVSIAYLAWRQFGGFFLPAIVNGQPIFGWEYIGELHNRAGAQTLDSLITQKLLVQEAAKRGVTVSEEEVESRIADLESNLEGSGGLDQALSFSGMTRDDLKAQIRLNLMVEKLVDEEIEISDEEIQQSYEDNKQSFANISKEEAMNQIREQLKSDKIQAKIASLIAELRDSSDIKTYLE